MESISSITRYINNIIQSSHDTFWKDKTFNYFVEKYLQSSYHTGKEYLHYNGKISNCYLYLGKIRAVNEEHTLIAEFSPKKFKAFCRRFNKYTKIV